MPNHYFDFKQFRVEQEHCAMKVSTEACIFGAWMEPTVHPDRVLDIGTGTGLLSLMLAQRLDVNIDAVEIDADSARQASSNFASSPWSSRLNVIDQDVFTLAQSHKNKYDLIISNPPFFTASQKSVDEGKNRSKHDTGLFTKEKFAAALVDLLSEKGEAFILYPKPEADEFSSWVRENSLFVEEVLTIYNQPKGPIFRTILKVTRMSFQPNHQEFYIRNGREFTQEFNELLKPYYLYL
ncbi:tRNA1(Val) (adenine(37)-N6)-methyltransferase [Reichenbachiella ulvae]|uniref:Methyltransferase n=1 Tax=Reichenbachiella ulvae TaxID=2980104 RepID=A0ABT3CWG1_9BACT|nr:methyltransferase [Reichenbachiella ulvae]MCV9387568.1 methyltransferase [Reichenbachiella ulvae]